MDMDIATLFSLFFKFFIKNIKLKNFRNYENLISTTLPHLKRNIVLSSFFTYVSKLLYEIHIFSFSLVDFKGKNKIHLLSSIIIGDLEEILTSLFVTFILSFNELPKKQQE